MTQSRSTDEPISPGDLIRAELKRRGWTQYDLADVLNRPQSRINELMQGKVALSPEMASALSAALGNSAEEWMLADAKFRLAQVDHEIEEVQKRSDLYQFAPVKEMQKRCWIDATDSPSSLENALLKFFQIATINDEPAIHGALRKTAPSMPMTPSQRAWAFRVRHVASAIPKASVGKYDDSKMDACLKEIRKLASYSAGVAKAPALLMRYGIRFVAVEGLSGAKVDGFATWLDEDSPVIGMSLRFDRIDNFWFTLGHEISHIKHRDIVPVDGDVADLEEIPLAVKSPIERRADQESASTFISTEDLQSFARRVGPFFSSDKINQFANLVKMHPCVIIGQLKHIGAIGPKSHTKNTVPIREAVISSAITDGWGKRIDIGGSS
jgi:HTH-type transcriptional regulator/antitoxin HigA